MTKFHCLSGFTYSAKYDIVDHMIYVLVMICYYSPADMVKLILCYLIVALIIILYYVV